MYCSAIAAEPFVHYSDVASKSSNDLTMTGSSSSKEIVERNSVA